MSQMSPGSIRFREEIFTDFYLNAALSKCQTKHEGPKVALTLRLFKLCSNCRLSSTMLEPEPVCTGLGMD